MTTASNPDVTRDVDFIAAEAATQSIRAVIRAAATFAAFCEHVEHNERNSSDDVLSGAASLRWVAGELAESSQTSLREAYIERIGLVERTSIHRYTSSGEVLSGVDALRAAQSWRDFQVAQLIHDRQFHPDVFGMPKLEQLRHYTLHVTKLAGMLVDAVDFEHWEEFRGRRLADLAIFGVKIATVCNENLADDVVP